MSKQLLEWLKALDENAAAFRTVGGIALGFFCLLIFLITIFRVDAAQMNAAHVLILVIGLVAFLIPWIEKFSWTKEGGGSIDFAKTNAAISSLDRKINFLSQASSEIQSTQTPKEVEDLKSGQPASAPARLPEAARAYKTQFEGIDLNVLAQIDPNKGRFGSTSSASADIRASVRHVSGDWYEVTTEIASKEGHSLPAGEVMFFLHPTFTNPVVTVPIVGDRAVLKVGAWGSFTIGAELPNGEKLEIDLARDVPGVPPDFIG